MPPPSIDVDSCTHAERFLPRFFVIWVQYGEILRKNEVCAQASVSMRRVVRIPARCQEPKYSHDVEGLRAIGPGEDVGETPRPHLSFCSGARKGRHNLARDFEPVECVTGEKVANRSNKQLMPMTSNETRLRGSARFSRRGVILLLHEFYRFQRSNPYPMDSNILVARLCAYING